MDEQAAIDAAGADTNDLTSGCGGFGWTAMRDSLPITGSWVDNYGDSHSIDAFGWTTDGSYHVSQSDSSMGWLVAQNDSNNTCNPDPGQSLNGPRTATAHCITVKVPTRADEAARLQLRR